MLGGRPAGFLLRQVVEPSNYAAMWRLPRVAVHPLDFAGRYLFGRGSYPAACPVRTSSGVIAPTVFSHHDVITLNEIFCRLDYRIGPEARTIVDIGSNIGISALYFLTAAPAARCFLFEPDPRNTARLRENLLPYEGRWELTEAAVADRAGSLPFGREATGRYGGLGLDLADSIEVRCLHINSVIEGVLERAEEIDLLKVDTEGQENATVSAIRRDLLPRIRVICFETREPVNPAPELFELHYAAETARLTLRRGAPAAGDSRPVRGGVA